MNQVDQIDGSRDILITAATMILPLALALQLLLPWIGIKPVRKNDDETTMDKTLVYVTKCLCAAGRCLDP